MPHASHDNRQDLQAHLVDVRKENASAMRTRQCRCWCFYHARRVLADESSAATAVKMVTACAL